MARHSPPIWPPAVPPCSSRPPRTSAPPCPHPAEDHRKLARDRIETTFAEITVMMGLARHGAHSFWGLLTRTAATITAHTLLRTCLAAA
jgi:hypothetical protein